MSRFAEISVAAVLVIREQKSGFSVLEAEAEGRLKKGGVCALLVRFTWTVTFQVNISVQRESQSSLIHGHCYSTITFVSFPSHIPCRLQNPIALKFVVSSNAMFMVTAYPSLTTGAKSIRDIRRSPAYSVIQFIQ